MNKEYVCFNLICCDTVTNIVINISLVNDLLKFQT